MNSFQLQQNSEGDVQVVSISGNLGGEECYRLGQELKLLLKDRKRSVILDCSQLTYVTNVSLMWLYVYAQDYWRDGSHFIMTGLTPAHRSLAQQVGFEESMLASDVAAARQRVEGATAAMSKGHAGKE